MGHLYETCRATCTSSFCCINSFEPLTFVDVIVCVCDSCWELDFVNTGVICCFVLFCKYNSPGVLQPVECVIVSIGGGSYWAGRAGRGPLLGPCGPPLYLARPHFRL